MQQTEFAACNEQNEAEEIFEHKGYHKTLRS
jgi:hypothetical protein